MQNTKVLKKGGGGGTRENQHAFISNPAPELSAMHNSTNQFYNEGVPNNMSSHGNSSHGNSSHGTYADYANYQNHDNPNVPNDFNGFHRYMTSLNPTHVSPQAMTPSAAMSDMDERRKNVSSKSFENHDDARLQQEIMQRASLPYDVMDPNLGASNQKLKRQSEHFAKNIVGAQSDITSYNMGNIPSFSIDSAARKPNEAYQAYSAMPAYNTGIEMNAQGLSHGNIHYDPFKNPHGNHVLSNNDHISRATATANNNIRRTSNKESMLVRAPSFSDDHSNSNHSNHSSQSNYSNHNMFSYHSGHGSGSSGNNGGIGNVEGNMGHNDSSNSRLSNAILQLLSLKGPTAPPH